LPPSKKRLYQFRQPEWQSPEDVRELLWRRHVYNNVVLSMRREFREEIDRDTREALNTVEDIKRREGEELNRLLAENEAKNRKKAAERYKF
jgi:hypothetical protein